MRKTMRKAMLSTICMLIVAVMSLTGVTYAWFTTSTSGQVTGMEMTVTSTSGGVQISVDSGNTWGSVIPVSTNVTAANPVSTIGGSSSDWAFYTAQVNEGDSSKIMSTQTNSTSGNYIKQVVWLKNEGVKGITIALGGSDANAKNTTITEDGTTYNGHLASRLGIVLTGAVSTINNEAVTTAKVNSGSYGIFEPNATTHLTGTGSAVTYHGIKDQSSDDVVEDGFDGYFNISGNETYTAAVTTVTTASDFEIYVPAQSIVKLEVYVWLEGQDSDCTNAVSSSKIKVDLCFEVKATDP